MKRPKNMTKRHLAYLINSAVSSTLMQDNGNISVRASNALRCAVGIVRNHHALTPKELVSGATMVALNSVVEAHLRVNDLLASRRLTKESKAEAQNIIDMFGPWCEAMLDKVMKDTSAAYEKHKFKTAGGIRIDAIIDYLKSREKFTMSALDDRGDGNYAFLAIRISHNVRVLTEGGVIKALERAKVIEFNESDASRVFNELRKQCLEESRLLLVTPNITELRLGEVLIPKECTNSSRAQFIRARVPTNNYPFNFKLNLPNL